MSEGPAQAASGGSSSTTYRCFLFADLRGYTAFLERAGNAAGVALLEDYLSIARAAVAQHHGAEIKTEGDGLYAVFPSASGAILCGLDIVRGAAAASADRPDRPIRVGVGIHAGEAVQTSGGFVGAAVNLAARVCATASAGEVLVTATVRGITRASIPVGFASRGYRRLKGVAESVEVFAVTGEGFPCRDHGPAGGCCGGIAAAVIAIAAVLACDRGSLRANGHRRRRRGHRRSRSAAWTSDPMWRTSSSRRSGWSSPTQGGASTGVARSTSACITTPHPRATSTSVASGACSRAPARPMAQRCRPDPRRST
jgi:class 3 adenylate cyclase